MKSEQITIRLEQHIIEHLKDEAKKRSQPFAALARTFIRDGLAHYDAISEELLQADERIEARLQTIEALVAANLHVTVQGQVLASKQKEDEADNAYVSRLGADYRNAVMNSIPKGSLIAAEVTQMKKTESVGGKR